MGATSDEVNVVIDEAHNFPKAVQDHNSPRLGAITLQRAVQEAEAVQDPVLASRILSTSFLHALGGAMFGLADEFVLGDAEDGLVPNGCLEERLMERLRVPSPVISQCASDLLAWGEIVREKKRAAGRLPRSYLGAVGAFLDAWLGSSEHPTAHLVEREPLAVEAALLEPSVAMGWMHEFASTVQMSGTLNPVKQQVSLCGLPADTKAIAFPSPFDGQRLQTYGLLGVHRRWQDHQNDPAHAIRQQEAAEQALATMPGRTALWFPSYAMLSAYLEEGFLHATKRVMFHERQDMDLPQAQAMLRKFMAAPGALLLAVTGGKMSEGIDFPGEALESCIVFGVPYPRPTARVQAAIHHNDRVRNGEGWQLSVHTPVGRQLRQTIGRMIRGPEDTGRAVILDERAARFHEHLPGLVMVTSVGETLQSVNGQGEFHAAGGLSSAKIASQPY